MSSFGLLDRTPTRFCGRTGTLRRIESVHIHLPSARTPYRRVCVSLKGRFSQSSYYATAWNAVLVTSPVLLYIAPQRIEEIPDYERRSVALFCLAAARYQLRHKRHFVLVHLLDSTFWMIPQATSLFSESSVSWGRIAQRLDTSMSSSFAKGQLDPLLCQHRAVKKTHAEPLNKFVLNSSMI